MTLWILKNIYLSRSYYQHFSGKGSKVTQKFKPIDGEIVDVCNGFFSIKLEQDHTNLDMKMLEEDLTLIQKH